MQLECTATAACAFLPALQTPDSMADELDLAISMKSFVLSGETDIVSAASERRALYQLGAADTPAVAGARDSAGSEPRTSAAGRRPNTRKSVSDDLRTPFALTSCTRPVIPFTSCRPEPAAL